MKTKKLTAILIAITAINTNLCMETQEKDLKQLIVMRVDHAYKDLKNILQKNIIDNYSAIHPALQHEMLKTCIDNNNMKGLEICLKHNFNPNRYHKGLSLLHCAIERNNPAALWFLADANPDLIPRNDVGETPLDYAVRLKFHNCIDAMSRIIAIKRDELFQHRKHCGLTKHILRPEQPCSKCISALTNQLQWHGIQPYSNSSDSSSHASLGSHS